MKFELIKKVPIVAENGVSWVYDTGFPGVETRLSEGSQQFFGIPGLRLRGVSALKRYMKFDYVNQEIITSDEPILLESGETLPLRADNFGWSVKMTVGGVEAWRIIDTGAAFSYVHNLSPEYQAAGLVEECDFGGHPWTAPMRRVPCEFGGHRFEILCGDARDNRACVPPQGVIGYDFFNHFTVVVDQMGGTITFKVNQASV